jgi:thiosulfate dehydrogenase [quinone] large subunit
MHKIQQHTLIALRLGIGWYFTYAGLSKILNPEWTAAGYLNNATTFPGLFDWLASAGNIGWVSFVNEWGLLLIGLGLMLGLLVRYASYAGIVLMVLYWLPVLDFPFVGHGFLVDDHIIYMLVFCILIHFNAGNYFGLDKYLSK